MPSWAIFRYGRAPPLMTCAHTWVPWIWTYEANSCSQGDNPNAVAVADLARAWERVVHAVPLSSDVVSEGFQFTPRRYMYVVGPIWACGTCWARLF